jgi:lipopolysaccharide export LptBFGC system permease protein LptF
LLGYIWKRRFTLFLVSVSGLLAFSVTAGKTSAGQSWGLITALIMGTALILLYLNFGPGGPDLPCLAPALGFNAGL